MCLKIFVSAAYKYDSAVVSQYAGRSMIYIKKSNRPSIVPCGMRLKTVDQFEQLLLCTTLEIMTLRRMKSIV